MMLQPLTTICATIDRDFRRLLEVRQNPDPLTQDLFDSLQCMSIRIMVNRCRYLINSLSLEISRCPEAVFQ